MKQTFRTTLATFAAATLVLAASQSFAAGTVAGTDISNTASVSYTIGGTPTTTPSNTESFRVDRKINPVVTNTGNATVVAGGTGYVLTFTVDNFSNSKPGDTDYFNITPVEVTVGDTFDMSPGYAVYDDSGTTPGSWDSGDALVSNPVTIARDATATFFIVADAPLTATAPSITAQYDLLATAADNLGAALAQAGANGKVIEDIAYGDAIGSASGDVAGDGKHSARGTYTTAGVMGVTKTASDPGFYIPGNTVTYSIAVNNSDTVNAASGVTISDPIPANTTYVLTTLTCTGTGFTAEYDHGAGFSTTEAPANTVTAVRCAGGSIAASGAASMSFSVTIN